VVSRLIPGVVGRRDSIERESFTAGLLKYPAYTRPREFMGFKVPEVLLSGNHAEIEKYRKKLSLELTLKKRPYLLASYPLSKEERNILKELLERQRLYLFLVHYPVLNKKGETIASAITNLDLHDLARLGRTYGVKGVYVIQPLEDQRTLGEELVKYWLEGKGGDYNPLRKEAMKVIRFFKNLEEAIDEVQKLEGERPLLLGTDASPKREFISYEKVRELLWENPLILVLGTAWGLTEEVLKRCDYFLEPIWGRLDFYNHLSVRSAASILVDRILGVYSICKKI
ncbi:MAG: hypothetical protein N3A56_04265, partial [Thermodesulfobacteriaceae bacterium]|nr:hypothetical protein [Thermodesulfobacteriaceae bacterium]